MGRDQLPPSPPGAQRPGPPVPPAPGCWLAGGPVPLSGSEPRGHPRVRPLVTCVAVLRMFCCCDCCAVSPPVPSV